MSSRLSLVEALFQGGLVYRHLDADLILQTLRRLGQRIEERFPGSGLARVAGELLATGLATREEVAFLRRPHRPLRLAAAAFILVLAGVLATAVATVIGLGDAASDGFFGSVAEVVQGVESLVQEAVFVGIAIWFFLSLESRLKRRRALRAVHELRSIAHIVDMHQLTKDPERLGSSEQDTASSPVRALSREQLGRYLDYCSELLSVTSKLAALYVQYSNDPVVLEAVSDVEGLTGSLSNKIWQKITLLDQSRVA